MSRNVKTAAAAMSRTNRPVALVREPSLAVDTRQPQRARDGLENIVAGLGTSRDKMSFTEYGIVTPMQRMQLEAMYRTSWLAKRIVNLPAEDMTREWRSVVFDSKDEKAQKAIEKAEKKHGLKSKVTDAISWGRLYGGALIILGVGRDDLSKPLDVTKVKKGDLKWLQVLDRWRVSPGPTRTQDLESPNFSLPDTYILAESSIVVHHTRVLRFNGEKLPYFAWLANAMWDDSALQHVLDSIKNCDVVTRAIATMMFEANVDVVTVPDLNELASTKDGEQKILSRFQLAATVKSFNRMLLLGDGETYEKKTNSFANLDKITINFFTDVCGAADIPMTRLFGQSAAGLQSTGDGELRNYYDMVSAKQENDLRPQLEYLDEILVRSELGAMPDDYHFDFNSLWQQSDKEVADTQYVRAQRDKIYIDAGVVTEGVVARQLKEDDTYPNMTDEDVELAEELSKMMAEGGFDPAEVDANGNPVAPAKPGAKPVDPKLKNDDSTAPNADKTASTTSGNAVGT